MKPGWQRWAWMAVGLVMSAPGFAQSLDTPVTLRLTATPVGNVLDALGKAGGLDLRPSLDVSTDVVVLSVKDQKLRDVMVRLAQALDAEWETVGAGYRLVRSNVIEQRQLRAEIAARTPRYQAALAAMAKAAAEMPELTPQRAGELVGQGMEALEGLAQPGAAGEGRGRGMGPGGGLRQMMGQLPGVRGVNELVALIDPAQLAAIGVGERRVFSTRPTAMQAPLPARADALVQRILREQAALTKALRDRLGDRLPPGLLGEGTAPRGAMKVLLVVTRPSEDDTLTVQMMLGDSAGQGLGDGFTTVQPEAPAIPANLLAGAGASPIVFDAQAQALAQLFASAEDRSRMGNARRGENEDARPAMTAELRQWILNPERVDPLSGAPSQMAFAVAGDRPLIALLPDTSLPALSRASRSPLTAAQARARAGEWDWQVVDRDGWVFIQPTQPVTSRKLRTHRAALGNALRQLVFQGSWSLDQRAVYALNSPERAGPGSIDWVYLRSINPGAADREMTNLFLGGARDLLRVFGGLTPSQRNQLSQNRPLSLGTLSPVQREAIHRMVFFGLQGVSIRQEATTNAATLTQPGGGQRGGQPGGQPGMGRRGGGPGTGMGMGMMMGLGGLANERTELLPNGIPSNGTLRWTVTQTAALYGRAGENGVPVLMDVEEAGRREAMRTAGAGTPAGVIASGPAIDRYQPVTRTNVTFQFDFTARVYTTQSLGEAPAFSSGAFVSYDQLPESVRRAADASAQRTRGMMDRMSQDGPPRRGGGRQAVP